MLWIRILLLVIVLGRPALALDFFPRFEPTSHVRVSPPGFVPEALGEAGIARLEAALRELHFPFYVLLSETLPGQGDEDVRAQALTDGLAAAWAPQGYDPAVSSLFALTFAPRKFSLLVGARWNAELGLRDAAVDRYFEYFLARVRGTPSDPAGGIAELAKNLDDYIFDQVDPERVAARTRAEAAQALKVAVGQLQERIDEALLVLADTAYPPPDAAKYARRVERAKVALTSSDVAAVTSEIVALDTDLAPLRVHVADAQAAAELRSMIYGFVTILVALLIVFLVIFFFVRSAQLRRRRRSFDELADAWNVKITNAAGRYVEFYGKRDGILGLLELEGKTKALLDQVTREVDAIYASVAAMEAHIKGVDEEAHKARWFRLRPIDQALVKLGAPFEFDTGVLDEADLFGPQTKQLRIDPGTLEAELEQRFAASLDGWKRLEAAADLRFHEAAELVPHTSLDEVLARAEAHRIPARWFADHPLYGDAAADATVWQTADAWRWKDAIAFMEAIEALRARHDAVVARLERLVAAREQVAAVHIATLGVVAPHGVTTRYDAADDPADTIEDARGAEADLEQRIIAAIDLDAVEEAARNTVALYRKTADQTARIEEALRRAEPEIEAAKRLGVLSVERLADARRSAEHAAGLHANSRASSLVVVLQRRREAADAEVRSAATMLAAHRHLDAHRGAERAKSAYTDVRAEADKAIAYVDALEATRLAYEQRVMALAQVRADKLAEIRRYGGAQALDDWRPAPIAGPVDYAALTSALDEAVEGWNAVVRRARFDWEEAERRRREAEEAERRRVAAAAAARSASTSWSSSSSSRSSFGSFSSSSRSSSSSSSRSGSWSGGRSSSRSGSW